MLLLMKLMVTLSHPIREPVVKEDSAPCLMEIVFEAVAMHPFISETVTIYVPELVMTFD